MANGSTASSAPVTICRAWCAEPRAAGDLQAAIALEVVHRSSAGALGVALSDLDTGVPTALQEVDLRSRLVVLDPSVEPDLARLKQPVGQRLCGGRSRPGGPSLAGGDWLRSSGAQYWLWEREADEIRKLFSVQPRLDDYALAPMESLDLRARDGRRLPAYLTRTPLASGTEPQPLVLLVHGGPQARDFWGFSSTHQLLANRGYHALSVNYRGSTGFGKQHLRRAKVSGMPRCRTIWWMPSAGRSMKGSPTPIASRSWGPPTGLCRAGRSHPRSGAVRCRHR